MTIQNATHEAATTFRDAQQRALVATRCRHSPGSSRFPRSADAGARDRRGAAGADGDRRRDAGRLLGAANGGALGHTLYAIELPGIGLTDRARYHRTTCRSTVAQDVPVLYFRGLLFQCAVACSVLPGVGHDAAYVAQHIHHPASARAAIAS